MPRLKPLSRRTVLRGLGSLVALPFLEAMAPHRVARAAAVNSPLRTLVFFVPNGMLAHHWTPTGEGANFELGAVQQSLAPFKDQLLFLSGLANEPADWSEGEVHSRCVASSLTCVPVDALGNDISVGEISFDQQLANEIGNQTRYPSLVLGSEGARFPCTDSGCHFLANISWIAPDTPADKDLSLQSVFDRLFAGADAAETVAQAAKRRAYEQSILDGVLEDAARLEARLGVSDRQRLDEYLTGIYELEHRLSIKSECSVDPASVDLSGGKDGAVDTTEHVQTMCDLMSIAFQCDQTRVISYMMGTGQSDRSYPELGVHNSHHGISHHGGAANLISLLESIEVWEMEQFAYLLERLAAIPDGDGVLLDHCQVLFLSGMGDGNEHLPRDLPIVIAGGANGMLTTGQHLMMTDQPLANLYISLLANAGVDVASFGANGTGPLDGLT